MTDDIKILLDRAADAEPLRAFDADTVVVRGRRRNRHRRLGVAGGAALGIAAATAATLVLTSLAGPAAGPRPLPGVDPAPPPDYSLPDLDPAKDYYWTSRDRRDDAVGAQLTDVIADHLAEHFPAARVVQHGPEFESDGVTHKRALVAPGADESRLRVSRYTNQLFEWVTSGGARVPSVVHEEPVYRFWANATADPEDDSMQTLDSMSGVEFAFDGVGRDRTDMVRFALYPPGGYRTGFDPAAQGARQASDGYLVEGCRAYRITDAHAGTGDDRRFSFDCDESSGPNGERIVTVAARETYLDADRTFTINTVVVTRPDGTAVVVSDTPQTGSDFVQGVGPVPTTPTMSLSQLTSLALAVPLVSFD